jgi:hypothetical protein
MIALLNRISLLILIVFVCLFSACSNPGKVPQDTFGELDTTNIAADTAMQANMDLSYEYQKTLVQNDSTVYDVLAYDKPSNSDPKKWEGKVIVIRRTNAKQDTIIKDNRFGPVKGLSLADLNHDGRPEILFYEDQTGDKNRWRLRIYTQKPDGAYRAIYMQEHGVVSSPGHYHGSDTFFVYDNHLIRRYPYYETNDTTNARSDQWQSYKLVRGQLMMENEKTVARK